MTPAATARFGQTTETPPAPSRSPEAYRHAEGPVARQIEEYTAQVPSDVFLWAAGASILGSLTLKCTGRDHAALFVGQWVAPFLVIGLYNKIVKVAGSDRVHRS
jgi:hypothetical protein